MNPANLKIYMTRKHNVKLKDMSKKRKIIRIDLSGCKNWNEAMRIMESITSGRVKIEINTITK